MALVVFVAVAVTIGFYVDRTAARSREARRARDRGGGAGPHDRRAPGRAGPGRSSWSSRSAPRSPSMPCRCSTDPTTPGRCWPPVARPCPTTPFDNVTWDFRVGPETVLVVRGARLNNDDQRVLRTFVSQLELALESRRLQAEVAAAASLADTDALRAALLQAVSHDLRTPLASIKASATSLLQDDVAWSDKERAEFLATIDAESDRLERAGGEPARHEPAAGRGGGGRQPPACSSRTWWPTPWRRWPAGRIPGSRWRCPRPCHRWQADPALLERVVANVVSNAVAWSPADRPIRVEAGEVGGVVHLRVVDQGPGLSEEVRERVFEPFQRFGDRSNEAGVGPRAGRRPRLRAGHGRPHPARRHARRGTDRRDRAGQGGLTGRVS